MKKKVFLDFGGNMGQGLRHFISKYNINSEEWIVETFEPNIDCELSKNIQDLDYVSVNQKAVWVYDGKVKFSKFSDTQGSSVECLMSDGICKDPKSLAFRNHENIFEVECLDISKILEKYKDFEFVLVKMDIEGSEFEVMRKAIIDETVSIINHLYIEWHYPYVIGESESTFRELQSKIIEKGVNVYEWT